ncbi:hypothetical protein ABVN55_06380 [Fusobacterium animalis]|jgi:hypothetical protein|uniref:P-type conjugative transfer protein TrbJ n=1 Tax=Fusobacterium animalis D11 TaxID=556264 RepID=D6BE78_9FUSO|nr:hypothetical protein [Fusobacterium nucleatum]EFD80475.1 P-type conjugative transfer protein TrbJ [Fusobacterium animalis D11]ERT37118.1 P-type conjugative transfer protein TrbJ [Fusobacterium nucleatum CTI-5]
MFKKKLLMILAIVVLISIPSQAGIFGGKGGGGSLKEILKLLKSIDAASGANGTATLAEIETKLQVIEQTKMQIEQLRMEVENFKQLGKDIKDFDLKKINNLLDRTLGFKDYASMTANQMEKKLDTFFSDYDGNKYKLFDKYDLDILKAQRKKLRENQQEMQKSVYNNMSKNQMYANIKDQGEALKRKVATLDSVAGTLQALQAIGGILEQTNEVLLEIKQMMATNAEMKDRIEAKVQKEAEISRDNSEAFQKEADEKWKEAQEEARKNSKKTNFNINFKKRK